MICGIVSLETRVLLIVEDWMAALHIFTPGFVVNENLSKSELCCRRQSTCGGVGFIRYPLQYLIGQKIR
jgi:hypothetical protein